MAAPDVIHLTIAANPIRHGRGTIALNKVDGTFQTFTPAPTDLNEFSVPGTGIVFAKYDGRFDDPTYYG